MSMVDVCLYNNNIYKLENWCLLSELLKGDEVALYEHLVSHKGRFNIKFAIIDFNQPLRNAVYTVFPSAAIIIEPIKVIRMINYYLGYTNSSNNNEEEIAAATDEQLVFNEFGCQSIYDYPTKKEAIHYYRQWQGDVPLGIKSFHHVIRTIDYYYEEIFNYFEFKSIYDLKHDKIR